MRHPEPVDLEKRLDRIRSVFWTTRISTQGVAGGFSLIDMKGIVEGHCRGMGFPVAPNCFRTLNGLFQGHILISVLISRAVCSAGEMKRLWFLRG